MRLAMRIVPTGFLGRSTALRERKGRAAHTTTLQRHSITIEFISRHPNCRTPIYTFELSAGVWAYEPQKNAKKIQSARVGLPVADKRPKGRSPSGQEEGATGELCSTPGSALPNKLSPTSGRRPRRRAFTWMR